MNLTETRQLLSVLKICWPTFQIVEASGDIPGTTEVWTRMLANAGVGDAVEATHKLSQTQTEGPPNIAQLKSTIAEIVAERGRDERNSRTRKKLEEMPMPSPERLRQFVKDMHEACDRGNAIRKEHDAIADTPMEVDTNPQPEAQTIEEQYEAAGLAKVHVRLPNGRAGFVWKRIRPMTNNEIRVAKHGNRITTQSKVAPPPEKYPPKESCGPDETHDWARTFNIIETVDEIMQKSTADRNSPPNSIREETPVAFNGASEPARERSFSAGPLVSTEEESPPPAPPWEADQYENSFWD